MLNDIKTKFEEIKGVHDSIDQLLDTGELRIKRNNGQNFVDSTDVPVGIQPLLEKEECYVCHGTFPVAGGMVPPHKHQGCLEYLIVVKGSMLIDFGSGVQRIVKEQACAAVDAGMNHSVKGLEDGTEYIVVCIPKDTGIANLLDRARKGELNG